MTSTDSMLAVLAAAMLMLLIAPRLRARVRGAGDELRVIQQLGSTVFCFVARSGFVRSVTANAREVLGEASNRAVELELHIHDLLQPEERSRLADWLDRAWHSEHPPPAVLAARAPDAGRRWLEVSTAGRVRLGLDDTVLLEIREVTSRVHRERHIHDLARALDAATDAAYITDVDGRVEYVNAAFERLFGYRAEQVSGRPISLVSSGKHRPDFFARMWQTLRSGQAWAGEVVNRRSDGSLCIVDLTITPLPGDDTTPLRYVALARDITGRKRFAQEVDDLAFNDPLTGLPSQRLLKERSSQVLALASRYGRTAAVLHVNVEQLTGLSAQHGRALGDEVLRTLAERLRKTLRDSDILGRLAGDDFLILLSEVTDVRSIANVVRRLNEVVAQPVQVQQRSVLVTARVGVAVYPQDANTFDQLQAAAEIALRRAERCASAFEFFEHSQSAASHERFVLEEDMQWAWQHDRFLLHFEPVVAARTSVRFGVTELPGTCAGFEAHACWPHMERGLLLREQFAALADRTGRLVALDRWAIAAAARQMATWNREGWDGWMVVRLCARALLDLDLPDYVARTVEAHGVGRNRLAVLVTEDDAMCDPALATRVLEMLRERGVLTALDSLGGAHSSLACLQHMPFDLLRLDAAFIREACRHGRVEPVLEIVMELAHRMGARVVANGVEDADQVRWLELAGCDFMQGRLIGRPAPAGEPSSRPAPAA